MLAYGLPPLEDQPPVAVRDLEVGEVALGLVHEEGSSAPEVPVAAARCEVTSRLIEGHRTFKPAVGFVVRECAVIRVLDLRVPGELTLELR